MKKQQLPLLICLSRGGHGELSFFALVKLEVMLNVRCDLSQEGKWSLSAANPVFLNVSFQRTSTVSQCFVDLLFRCHKSSARRCDGKNTWRMCVCVRERERPHVQLHPFAHSCARTNVCNPIPAFLMCTHTHVPPCPCTHSHMHSHTCAAPPLCTPLCTRIPVQLHPCTPHVCAVGMEVVSAVERTP